MALRPPDFLRPSTSVRSGSVFVISAKSGYETKRRPGLVGLGLRMGIGLGLLEALRGPGRSGWTAPGATCTIAFFHERVRPGVWPRRLGLDFTDMVRTR